MRGDIFRTIQSKFKETVFKDYYETVWVYLKATNTKGSTYDPYRQTGYTITNHSPLSVKAYVRQLTSSSLIMRELGLVESGAIEIVVEDSDVNLFKFCEKVKYDDNQYTPFRSALGNRVQITKISFGFYKIVLFKVGN